MGRGLPCVDMHVRTRLSPSLRDIEGNPDIVGASGGPGNMKVSKLQIEKFSRNIIDHSILPLLRHSFESWSCSENDAFLHLSIFINYNFNFSS